jgi:hypothetical protein
MEESWESNITTDDVDSFARKLEEWSSSLPSKERALLAVMLAETKQAASGNVPPGEGRTALIRFEAPLESIVGRFTVEPEGADIFIKESGPTWVNSPHHLGDWAEVVLPE